MSRVSVVEARVFRFLGLKMTVEGVRLLSDFGDQAALEDGMEVGRIVGLWAREHVLVDHLINLAALHLGGRLIGGSEI